MDVMIEDNDGGEVDEAELKEWADQYGLSIPVVSDPGSSVLYRYATGSIGLPYKVLIDHGVVVESINASDSELTSLLSE